MQTQLTHVYRQSRCWRHTMGSVRTSSINRISTAGKVDCRFQIAGVTYVTFFAVFLPLISGQYINLGHNRFLPHSVQLIIHSAITRYYMGMMGTIGTLDKYAGDKKNQSIYSSVWNKRQYNHMQNWKPKQNNLAIITTILAIIIVRILYKTIFTWTITNKHVCGKYNVPVTETISII